MSGNRTVRGRLARGLALAAFAALVGVSGCAYYNTFYNAKKAFKKAEADRRESPGSGGDSYQRCIDKCQLLLRYYPKSKYVDDALYLIGLSRLYRGEFVQARASLDELVQRFPDSEYVERALYYNGLAAIRQEDPAGAAQAFGKLASQFPKSDLNVEAVFRQAEARLDSRDYDKAREELRAFVEAHPKSRLVLEAQLRIARTYYDEERYEEARAAYAKVLALDVTPEMRYEARLHTALSQRVLAENVLANPVLQRASRMRRAAKDLARFEAAIAEIAAREAENRGRVPGRIPGGMPPRPGDARFSQAPAGQAPGSPPGSAPGTPAPGTPAGAPAAVEAAAADSSATSGPEAVADADSAASAPGDTLAFAALTPEEEQQLQKAERELDDVARQLDDLRKPAGKLGQTIDLAIEIAVTRALRGEPGDAIADLDQIARTQPRSETAAIARYEIGEIYRRLGEFDKARTAYDESVREKQSTSVSDQASRKSMAIVARGQARDALRDAPETLQRWQALQAAVQHEEATTPAVVTAADSSESQLGESIAVETAYEELARQQLRIAEIDLFELSQPLVALHEFQDVLQQYPGSLQEARAAFGIAYIYHHELHDAERARQAYANVVRDHADTPQGREAREILDRWAKSGELPEVNEPSPRP